VQILLFTEIEILPQTCKLFKLAWSWFS